MIWFEFLNSVLISETPLTLLVSLPHPTETILALVGGGAHLDFRSKKGFTPLHVAAQLGNEDAIRVWHLFVVCRWVFLTRSFHGFQKTLFYNLFFYRFLISNSNNNDDVLLIIHLIWNLNRNSKVRAVPAWTFSTSIPFTWPHQELLCAKPSLFLVHSKFLIEGNYYLEPAGLGFGLSFCEHIGQPEASTQPTELPSSSRFVFVIFA